MSPKHTVAISIAAIALAGCATQNPAPESPRTLKVSNLRHGLIEFDSRGNPRIYETGDSFPFKVNGTCVVAGQQKPCVWHGFEFDFESPESLTELQCVSQSNRIGDIANPSAVLARNTMIDNWRFEIKGQKGYYIRPQYTTNVKGQPFRTITHCSYHGKDVFEFSLTLLPQ